jgi:hypothetical protein
MEKQSKPLLDSRGVRETPVKVYSALPSRDHRERSL